MTKQIEIATGSNEFRPSLVALLESEKLPVNDLSAFLDKFFIALDDDIVVGAIGLEQYENCGLLRSLVVNPDYRNEQIAGKLVQRLENLATMSGIACIYLLTETAPDYFARKGYEKINRADVPAVLQQSSEFAHVCPQSAIVMKKELRQS